MADESPFRRVLLVGFMGSGKSTVGRALALRLGWDFLDFDAVIEEEAGRSVSRIFRELGEERFRALESRVGRELLARERAVLATGGGWPAAPGRMEGLDPVTLSVWLRVSPEEAVRRARSQGDTRPLLQTEAPVERARTLLEARIPFYGRARLALDSEAAGPEALVRRIAREMGMPAEPALPNEP